MTDCRSIEPRLSDFLDGAMAPDDRRLVDAHLEQCARCAGVLRDLERIRGSARSLGPVAPPEHVWLEVAGQARPAGSGDRRVGSAAESRVALRQWVGLAAMLVIVTLAAYFVMRPPATPESGAAGNAAPGTSVQAVTEDLGKAMQHYESAISKLETLAKDGDAALDPAIAATLQRNIQTIDGIIAESRSALGQNPESTPARESLFEALKTKVGVLQATLNLMNEMRKGDQAAAVEAAAVFGRKSS